MPAHTDAPQGHTPARPKKFYQHLYLQVLLGVGLGILLGYLRPDVAASLKPLGDAFVKIVKMMIVPVVFCTIVTGIAGVGGQKRIGPTLLKAFGLFYALTVVALLIGIATVEILQPGAGMHIDPHAIDAKEAARYAASAAKLDLVDVLLHIVPPSFFSPFAEGEVLPVLFVAVVLASGCAAPAPPARRSSAGSNPSPRACSPPSACSCGSPPSAPSGRWPTSSPRAACRRSAISGS